MYSPSCPPRKMVLPLSLSHSVLVPFYCTPFAQLTLPLIKGFLEACFPPDPHSAHWRDVGDLSQHPMHMRLSACLSNSLSFCIMEIPSSSCLPNACALGHAASPVSKVVFAYPCPRTPKAPGAWGNLIFLHNDEEPCYKWQNEVQRDSSEQISALISPGVNLPVHELFGHIP